eukprot:scaffold5335_cov175-Prasinococcus_capsulatus_cf.AAC.1
MRRARAISRPRGARAGARSPQTQTEPAAPGPLGARSARCRCLVRQQQQQQSHDDDAACRRIVV